MVCLTSRQLYPRVEDPRECNVYAGGWSTQPVSLRYKEEFLTLRGSKQSPQPSSRQPSHYTDWDKVSWKEDVGCVRTRVVQGDGPLSTNKKMISWPAEQLLASQKLQLSAPVAAKNTVWWVQCRTSRKERSQQPVRQPSFQRFHLKLRRLDISGDEYCLTSSGMLRCRWFPTFRRNLLRLSSGLNTLRMYSLYNPVLEVPFPVAAKYLPKRPGQPWSATTLAFT